MGTSGRRSRASGSEIIVGGRNAGGGKSGTERRLLLQPLPLPSPPVPPLAAKLVLVVNLQDFGFQSISIIELWT